MEFVEKIRQLFTNSGFIISDGVLSMAFVNEEGMCTTQEICNTKHNKECFDGFFENAGKLNISIRPEKLMACLNFYSTEYKSNSGISYYFPIENNITAEELQEELEKNSGNLEYGEYDYNIPFELNRFFKNVDFNDDAQVSEALKKWYDETQPAEEQKILAFSYIRKWVELKKTMREFQRKYPWIDLEIEDPDEFCNTGCGIFNFCISDDTANENFDGEMLRHFGEIIKQAGLIVIESENDKEISMSITVFPTEDF